MTDRTETKTLADLLPDLQLPAETAGLAISGLQLDSRRLAAGELFLAVAGNVQDGRSFLQQAAEAGACAALAEAEGLDAFSGADIPVIPVSGLGSQLSAIAGRFYDNPSWRLTVIGVTGTNGKTTCSQLLAQLFQLCGQRAGVIGTLGYGVVDGEDADLTDTGLTTPDAVQTQAILTSFADEGVQRVAMEVSSHSLDQNRVGAVQFDAALFTNLSRDHLDYHGDFESYARAKAGLFASAGLRTAVINYDDPVGRRFLADLPPAVTGYSYSTGDSSADLYATDMERDLAGISATVVTPWGDGKFHSCLLGDFNLSNLLAVIAAACSQGIALDAVLEQISRLRPVAGRMDLVDPDRDPKVVVDYAHTPDALEQALQALRGHCRGNLWCVFGCGGDRDRGKRPQMGEVAGRLADRVVVTSDNPRSEDPGQIIDEILTGLSEVEDVLTYVDRREAIRTAVFSAASQDTVLVAGKGHESYQQVGDRKLPFSDVIEARLALRARGDIHDRG